MTMTGYILYGLAIVLLIISALKSKEKTKKALKQALNTVVKLLPAIIPMMLFIGFSLSILSPSTISAILGDKSGVIGVGLGLIVGSVAFLPSFVAFPLGASLLEHGAGYAQVAAFIGSLISVGIVSLGVEAKYFGKKSAILRNSLAFIASAVFAVIIWGVM